MRRITLMVTVLGFGLLPVGGCPTSTGGGTTGQSLTDEQKAAVKLVVDEIAAGAAVFGTVNSLSAAQLDLDSIGPIVAFGTCPAVSLLASADTVVGEFDFSAAGCSGPATGGQTVSGGVTVRITRGTRAAAIEFANLTINGKAISGRIDVTIRRADNTVTLEGTCDLTTSGIGSVIGNITLAISQAGLITVSTGSVSASDGTTPYQVTLSNLVIDPATHGNFVPQSGTATFDMPNTGAGPSTLTVVVTFTSQSPVDGTVSVKVGAAPAVDYKIPGISA